MTPGHNPTNALTLQIASVAVLSFRRKDKKYYYFRASIRRRRVSSEAAQSLQISVALDRSLQIFIEIINIP